MGTLTAGQPRLAGYCDHKLPTSCRLSSIPECCACADERAHAASYSTYIDGIGFVPRGNRWQRYCWFCKEFWENRVRQSGLRPGQTRIPEVPDQTEFLKRWYDFHRGYRTITKEDGSEERIAVLGEELKEVSPGDLPRTLEELRAGREQSALEEEIRSRQQAPVEDDAPQGPSIEDQLEQLFELEAGEERQPAASPARQAPAPTSNLHAQAMVAAGTRNREYQARRVAALRRELHRMRNGIERVISGLRELGENVPDATEATGNLENLGQTLDTITGDRTGEQAELAIRSVNALTSGAALSQTDQAMASMQARVDGAREQVNHSRRMRDQAASELDLAEQEFRSSRQRLQQLQRDQRTTENYTRIFGTREEMQQQGENYESPIAGMFTRAYGRYRDAEEVRREERTLRQVLDDEAQAGGEEAARRLAELGDRQRDIWGIPRPPRLAQESTSNTTHLMEEARDEVFAGQDLPPGQREDGDAVLEEYYAMLRRSDWTQPTPTSDATSATEMSFPGSMLQAVVSARELETQQRNDTWRDIGDNYRASIAQEVLSPVEPYSSLPIDRQRDLTLLLVHLEGRESLPDSLDLSHENITEALSILGGTLDHDEMMSRLADRNALGPRYTAANLLAMDDIIWAARIPMARLARLRTEGNRVSFSAEPQTHDLEVRRGNIEIMAETFQMSAELRRSSALNAPGQLAMLYRLQANRRELVDIAVLDAMLESPDTVRLASRVHLQQMVPSARPEPQQRVFDEQRRQAARDGDYSRQGLQAQRTSQATAVLAGQLAWRTGAQNLMDRMRPTADDIYRLGFDPTSPASDSDPDEDEDAKGLDAPDSGRPEPKTEEEMTFKLDCKICFSQTADTACLPCGHLVMCKFCSDQHSPTLQHDRTRPRRAAACPVCRKGIRQKVRVFRA